MPQYSVDQIVGKTLYASTSVPIKRLPTDGATVVYTVKPGGIVGVVDSWLMPNKDRSNLYWLFFDGKGKAYYVEHVPGRFSLTELRDQGALDVKQEQAQKDEAGKSNTDKITDTIKKVGIIAVVIAALSFGGKLLSRHR